MKPTAEDERVAREIVALSRCGPIRKDNNVAAVEVDTLIDRIASMRASEREKAAKELKALYDLIFIIKSTGDPKHPVKGEINYDAKEEFEQALETAIRANKE